MPQRENKKDVILSLEKMLNDGIVTPDIHLWLGHLKFKKALDNKTASDEEKKNVILSCINHFLSASQLDENDSMPHRFMGGLLYLIDEKEKSSFHYRRAEELVDVSTRDEE